MSKKWYVLHVLTGSELEVHRRLREKGVDSMVVQETSVLRRGGKWQEVTRTLFPGYVFVFMKFTVEMHYILRDVSGVIRLLPKDKPQPLYPEESAWLISVGDTTLIPSTVDFSGEKPVVVSGPLKELQQHIVKINRRQRRVSLRVPVLGDYKDITLSIIPV